MHAYWRSLSLRSLRENYTGNMYYWGGCCLRPLPPGLPWGKEQGWLSWLQSNIAFVFMVCFPLYFWSILVLVFKHRWSVPTFEYIFKSFEVLNLVKSVNCLLYSLSGSQSDSWKGVRDSYIMLMCRRNLLGCWELSCGDGLASGWSLPPSFLPNCRRSVICI